MKETNYTFKKGKGNEIRFSVILCRDDSIPYKLLPSRVCFRFQSSFAKIIYENYICKLSKKTATYIYNMRKFLVTVLAVFLSLSLLAQTPGDTIKVQSFIHSSTTRDTLIDFPDISGVRYEKILMLYNIRCTDGLVSQPYTGQTNIGCGEWDYSCNTFVIDSSRVDSSISIQKSHTITNYSGTTYPFTTQTTYDFYRYIQQNTSGTTVVSETQSPVGNTGTSLSHVLPTDQNSGKSKYLFTQAELTTAGVIAGDLDGIILNALSVGTANFLRVRIKHTSLTVLAAASIDTSGFNECYFANTSFVTGNNRLQFHTPFNWDGISNVIIEFSFTNTIPSTALAINGDLTSGNNGLYVQNGYCINTATGNVDIPTDAMGSIYNEITVSLWTKGDIGITNNTTSSIAARDTNFNRQLNVHNPWNNGNVYFDCGNDGTGYDRIYTSINPSDVEGQWNHWAFTKNAVTGDMKAYLNGNLWHSGTGKIKTINLDSMILGSEVSNYSYAYTGNLDELRIWDTELSQTEIQNWMYSSIDSTHPKYSNLVAYYQLDEGIGTTSADASGNAMTGTFNNQPIWKYDRGIDLNRFFAETMERPIVTFLQGSYNLLVVNDTLLDSIPKTPNTITEYQIIPRLGTGLSDSINIASTNFYWETVPEYIYDVESGVLIDSIPVTAFDTIHIIDLRYYNRYVGRLELMSFVTPYGINLDLGMEGKTWTFDVTDFTPVLRGSKRIVVQYGAWQEDMNISFLFIVGTPPHDVIDFRQIWRPPSGGRSYHSILDDQYFEPRKMYIDPVASYVKLRSVITGHGQEGEFIPRSHYLDIDGGNHEFVWTEWTECAENPIYPQGGTWIYDRAGWCPGMPSDPAEFDATPYVTPGDSITIDYGLYTATGSSNYIVNNQMVTYGNPNFTLDASVVAITAPTNQVEYFRTNSICANPKVLIRNTGATSLTSLTFDYWVNGATSKETYTWNGSLDFLADEEVTLPSPSSLWSTISTTDNYFHVEISNPNGGSDEYSYNNSSSTDFSIPKVIPSNSYFQFKTNSQPLESKYELFDDAGNLIFSRSGMSANTIYKDTFNLGVGCYSLIVSDLDDDGINFWANNDGSGYMYFRQIGGGIVHQLEPDFGGSIIFNFTVDFPLTYEELYPKSDINLYPNPAKDYFVVEGDFIEEAEIHIFNSIGQEVFIIFSVKAGHIEFNTTNAPKGLYFVSIKRGRTTITEKIIIE